MHYVFTGGRIVGRTTPGRAVTAWHAGPEVVFEVDEVDGLFAWRSVLVAGRIEVLDPHGNPAQRRHYLTAIDALRTLHPGAFTERDPVPQRALVFVVMPIEMTGREALERRPVAG